MLEQYLVILFVKLAVSASLASIIVRPGFVKGLLLEEERTLEQRLKLAVTLSVIYGTSVATRALSGDRFQALDLGPEGALLSGLLGGYVCGLTSGVLISLPAMLLQRELLSTPVFAAVGVIGGLLRDLAPDKEDIWRFSPFVDLNLYRLIRQRRNYYRGLFHFSFLLTILFGEFLLVNLGRLFEAKNLFFLYPANPTVVTVLCTYGTALLAIVLPLKVWNNARVERKLESQQVLLTEARLAALTRQINPHFLFNTLNSVSSLIRVNPEQARTMIYKLSNILRRLLRKQENLTSLREEVQFIEDYLAIEVVRFGDKLKFEREVDPLTLDTLVPSMILQPIVENSIKHGLGPKVEGGRIRLESRTQGNRLLLTVEDDGVGMPEEKLHLLFEQQGIGISNVNERLKVLYGNGFRMSIHSTPGQGTRTEIEIPQLTAAFAAVS